MIVKVIGTLILGGGLGIPMSATLRHVVATERIPRILKNSDAVVKLEWTGEGASDEVGQLIDGIGKIFSEKKVEPKTKNSESVKVIGVRISTKGVFDENVCTTLGFDPGLKEPPINPNEPSKEDQIKGIGCYTNLHI